MNGVPQSAAPVQRVNAVEVKLVEPVLGIGGELISSITVKRPRGRQMRLLLPSTVPGERQASFVQFAAACCELPESVLDALDAEDFTKVMEVVANFVPGGTGAKPSS